MGTSMLGLLAALSLVGIPMAQACVSPETKGGVLRTVMRSGEVCARTINSRASISRGVAALAIHEATGSSCSSGGPSCEEVWAYTGRDWGRLGRCTQYMAVYPTTLPGRLVICPGLAYTLVRSGPGFNYQPVDRVAWRTYVGSDQVKLVTPAQGATDGLAWYRINWHGHAAWVASYRVTTIDNGCDNWELYWKTNRHP